MKQDRIDLRASSAERERFSEAAMFSGMNLSAFVRQATLEKADNVLKDRDTITLSDRDRDIFLAALENPPKLNKRLRQAFKEYYKQINNLSCMSSVAKRSTSRTKKAKTASRKEK